MPLITNDAVTASILFLIVYGVFKASYSTHPLLVRFFSFIPAILLCYFIPGVLNTIGVFSGEDSQVYPFVSKYLLPVCLLFFTISLDLNMIKKMGSKALIVFLMGSLGVIVGGPLALFLVSSIHPALSTENPDLWKGLGTIGGSWIGGGANQTALKEILQPNPLLFSQCIAVDVLIAELWLAVLLWGVGRSAKIDKLLQADEGVMVDIEKKALENTAKERPGSFFDILELFAIGFICLGIANFLADLIVPYIKANLPYLEKISMTSNFFWVICIITILGILLSRSKFKKLEEIGASKYATIMLYILIAAIGMQMNITAALDNGWLFLVGLIWIATHILFIVISSRILKVPYFVLAVGSQANIGGAASASVVAGAFQASLVSIGVLFAVLGYAIGTYGGYLTAILMRWVQTMFV